jgi:DNA polymerase I-like protein with 3'-5' exonuclease and polymerase domains
MAKFAGILLRNSLKGTTANIVLLEHDCWILECDEKDSTKYQRILADCMRRAAKLFCPSVIIPTDAIVSTKWDK